MTAVEWMVNEMFVDIADWQKDLIQQALEIEKQQIIDAFDEGNPNGFIIKDGEEYYNETYKKYNP
jgi:hypothetical protein